MIIGVSGYSGCGKDTVGTILQQIDKDSHWEIKKWAGKLKQVAELLTGIPVEKFEDQEFKKTNLGKQWNDRINNPMSVRDFLQKLIL